MQADHITALGALRERYGCVSMMGQQSDAKYVSENFNDGRQISVDSLNIYVMYTPGHTDNSYSFYVPQLNSVFTGNTLLIRGTGRTDFKNGDSAQQFQSIFEKILKLPATIRVFPGPKSG